MEAAVCAGWCPRPTDLLLKRNQERSTRPAVQLLSVLRRRKERAKARATVAAELMSWPVLTMRPEAEVAEVARRLPSTSSGESP
jgi:hypothetical protein